MAAGCCCCCCVNFSPFFLVVVVVVSRERERDEIRYGLGMSPVHSNALGSVQALVCHATQHTPKVSGEISTRTRKIKMKKEKIVSSVRHRHHYRHITVKRKGAAAAAAEGFTDDIVRTPHKRPDNRCTGAPEICDGGRPGGRADGRARVRSAQQRRFETDDYGMEERSTPLGIRPQIFFLFLFVSATFTCTQDVIPGVVYVARSLC
jgi:hypothetical protein